MKKLIMATLAMAVAAASLSLSGCGSNAPGDKVLEALKLMGKGDWITLYDKLHNFSKYTPEKETWASQMAEAGKPLAEFLKDAQFEVESEQFEKEWSFEGAKFADVTRVTVKMLPGQTKEWPVDFPFAATLGQTMRCEFLYSDMKENPGVIVNMGKPPLSHWVYMMKEKDEYASPGPAFIVSDPDPEKPGNPPVASFYWMFDSNYKGKYLAVPLETYTKTLVVAINPDTDSIRYVRQAWPLANQMETSFMDQIFKPYSINVNADTIATMVQMPISEPAYNPYAKAVKEAVAQVLKLYTINKMGGYAAFHEKYPRGLLAVRKGSKLNLVPFIDTNGKTIDMKEFGKGGNTAIMLISSCGSCQNTALETMKDLGKLGLPQSRVIFVSTSPKDKLGDFPKKIGSARLVIDDKQLHAVNLRLNTTPSLVIVDREVKVLAFLESNDIDNKSVYNRELDQALR
jgi:hypothetical protein